jgi:hypothetical protein
MWRELTYAIFVHYTWMLEAICKYCTIRKPGISSKWKVKILHCSRGCQWTSLSCWVLSWDKEPVTGPRVPVNSPSTRPPARAIKKVYPSMLFLVLTRGNLLQLLTSCRERGLEVYPSIHPPVKDMSGVLFKFIKLIGDKWDKVQGVRYFLCHYNITNGSTTCFLCHSSLFLQKGTHQCISEQQHRCIENRETFRLGSPTFAKFFLRGVTSGEERSVRFQISPSRRHDRTPRSSTHFRDLFKQDILNQPTQLVAVHASD